VNSAWRLTSSAFSVQERSQADGASLSNGLHECRRYSGIVVQSTKLSFNFPHLLTLHCNKRCTTFPVRWHSKVSIVATALNLSISHPTYTAGVDHAAGLHFGGPYDLAHSFAINASCSRTDITFATIEQLPYFLCFFCKMRSACAITHTIGSWMQK
jgi:hypothetical protein